MYADDLTLICNSASVLQAMLVIVSEYATTWRYSFNASKSSILVFGESPSSRSRNRPLRSWRLGADIIPESDTQLLLGVLHSVSSSNVTGRSAFYTLNVVGSRFGCLHPVTSLRLYTTFCIPILLYGCELWPLTKTETTMLKRVHRKILRTITGLPLRCNSKALQHSMGVPSTIQQRQLMFIHSFSVLTSNSLPRQVLASRISSTPLKRHHSSSERVNSEKQSPIAAVLHPQR